jgi:hypothetical protein
VWYNKTLNTSVTVIQQRISCALNALSRLKEMFTFQVTQFDSSHLLQKKKTRQPNECCAFHIVIELECF